MTYYASRTGTRRHLSLFRKEGWRLLVSAAGRVRTEGFRYGLDNGAWSAFQQGTPFDYPAFRGMLQELGHEADWFILPDIVEGGRESLNRSLDWLEHGALPTLPLLAVQDGIIPDDVRPLLGSQLGLAVGGSTPWKLRTVHAWARLAKETGCYLHVLRVNTAKRLNLCRDAGADSCDGSGASRFHSQALVLKAALRQGHLWAS